MTNEPFIPNPLAPASERSKDVFIGGKEVRVTPAAKKWPSFSYSWSSWLDTEAP